jgi:hypothetical protein
VEEDAIIRDCRRIETMGVMYKVGIIDYLVSGFCGGDRKMRGKEGGEGEEDKEKEGKGKKEKGKKMEQKRYRQIKISKDWRKR